MTLDEWMRAVAGALGADLSELGELTTVRAELLDVARDAAHGIARPAAPLTTFLLGMAVGRGMPLAEARAAIDRLIADAVPA